MSFEIKIFGRIKDKITGILTTDVLFEGGTGNYTIPLQEFKNKDYEEIWEIRTNGYSVSMRSIILDK